VRVTDADEVTVAAEFPAERSAGAVDGAASDRMIYTVLPAGATHVVVGDLTGLADAEAQGRIPRISLEGTQQVVPLRAHIAQVEKCSRSQLALNRQLIFLGIRYDVLVVERRRGTNGEEVCPVDRSVAVGERDGETLALYVARCPVNEWCNKF